MNLEAPLIVHDKASEASWEAMWMLVLGNSNSLISKNINKKYI